MRRHHDFASGQLLEGFAWVGGKLGRVKCLANLALRRGGDQGKVRKGLGECGKRRGRLCVELIHTSTHRQGCFFFSLYTGSVSPTPRNRFVLTCATLADCHSLDGGRRLETSETTSTCTATASFSHPPYPSRRVTRARENASRRPRSRAFCDPTIVFLRA